MKIYFFLLFIIAALFSTAQPGTLDNTFGTGGKVIENFSSPYVFVIDIIAQPDGKMIVLAFADHNRTARIVMLRYNSNGKPDSTFDGDGIVNSLLPQSANRALPMSIKLQPNGKILVCGSTYTYPNQAFVARYNINGSFDATFGSNGVCYVESIVYNINDLVIDPYGYLMLLSNLQSSPNDLALTSVDSSGIVSTYWGYYGTKTLDITSNVNPDYKRMLIQADGKYIVGGNSGTGSGNYQQNLLLARININGTIDNTYGVNGKIETDAGPAYMDDFLDMKMQPDGKVVVTGLGKDAFGNCEYSYITRYNSNGTIDNSFGTNGTRYISAASTGFILSTHFSFQADGKILLPGTTEDAIGNTTIAAARLTANGLLDNTFDNDGIAVMQVNNFGSYATAILQQADGKIVIVGHAGNGNTYTCTIGRLTATGQQDNSIDVGGTAITYLGTGTANELGIKVLLQPDQKIINIRSRVNGLTDVLFVTRHNQNGTPDNTFGTNGKALFDLPGSVGQSFAGLLGSGKIVTVFNFNHVSKGNKIGILKFQSSGVLDSSFGTSGKFFFNTGSPQTSQNQVIDVVVQADGKMLIETLEKQASGQPAITYLVRLIADGNYDTTFNNNGRLLLADSVNSTYGDLALQSDGKILITRHLFINSDYHTFIKRLNANGTPDYTFNNGNFADIPVSKAVIAFYPNGKIILASPTSKVARLNTNGTLDYSFYSNGVSADYYPYLENINVVVQQDEKILLSGSSYNPSTGSLSYQVARLQNDGGKDNSFGPFGSVFVEPVAANSNYSTSMLLQADGKILVSGYTQNENYYNDFAMIRLNNNGLPAGQRYVFTGTGNWSNPANWGDGAVPPSTISAGSSVVLDSPTGGECILDVTLHVAAGATFTVKAGKNFRIAGGLILQ